MPKSKRKSRVSNEFKAKFKRGDQVLYEDNEYFVVQPDRKHVTYMKVRRRFRPYARQDFMVEIRKVVKNREIPRRNLKKGDIVLFDVDSHLGVASCVLSRVGDELQIQPLHVRHIYTVSIFSDRINPRWQDIHVQECEYENYIPRIPSLNDPYLQAKGTWRGSSCTVVDYEMLPDRYLITTYGDYHWVKREEINIDYGDKDPYDCNWVKIGELKFTYADLRFSSLRTSYEREQMETIGMDTLKLDLWYYIFHNGVNHFAQNYDTDIGIFVILMWLENHETYWKKQHLFWRDSSTDYIESNTCLINSLIMEEPIDMELISQINQWNDHSTSTRRRANAIEQRLRSKPMFKTELSYCATSETITVAVMQPTNAKLRMSGFGRSFIYNYISKVLWYLSNRPSALTWAESRSLEFKLPVQTSRIILKVPLKPFQERIVYEMRSREINETNDLLTLNTKEGITFNAVSGYDWAIPTRGGILSLDTGLGKTICSLALIKQGIDLYDIKPTLVVLPLTLIDQWIKELQKFTDLTYGEVHGRKNNIEDAIRQDVVFTTYGTLLSNYNKDMSSPLFTAFKRVIFDESHQCKTYNSTTVAACYAVHASFRWCLTATPLRKGSFSNLHPQLKMLNIRPFQDQENYFKCIMEREDDRSKWILQQLASIVIKPELNDYVHIPEPSVNEVQLTHDTDNTLLYDSLSVIIRDKIRNIWQEGGVYSNFQLVKSLLNRLSICAIDPSLIPMHMWGERCLQDGFSSTNVEQLTDCLGNSKFDNEVKQTLQTLEETTCCLCLEIVSRPTITNCQHIFCHDCIKRSMEFKNKCPVCRNTLIEDQFKEIKPQSEEDVEIDGFIFCNDLLGRRVKVPKHICGVYSKRTQSNKRKWLLNIIKKRNKVVVYSQFNTVLETYATDIVSSIITGKSSRSQRRKNIDKFKRGDTKVFFLSTKVADVGINLTEGDTLVFLEPGLESAVEKQALGRLKRIGQEKVIEVYNVTMANTIEEKIRSERTRYDEAVTQVMTSDGSKSYKTKRKKQFFLRYIIDMLELH
jgi:SNF2 family DNA or RNA helicase